MKRLVHTEKPYTVFYPAQNRGITNQSWLKSFHSFSFGGYHDPEKMHFGALRVLNDDTVSPGAGFGLHRHENMEIITIPITGSISHSDSMGDPTAIKRGEVQVMSAGGGLYHSEMNRDPDQASEFLQIWIYPDKYNVTPRYQQSAILYTDKPNQFMQIVSPNPDDEGLWIHQQAWLSLGRFEAGCLGSYAVHKQTNGIYIFLINGKLTINDRTMQSRDALSVQDLPLLNFHCTENSEVLLIEVPMQF